MSIFIGTSNWIEDKRTRIEHFSHASLFHDSVVKILMLKLLLYLLLEVNSDLSQSVSQSKTFRFLEALNTIDI